MSTDDDKARTALLDFLQRVGQLSPADDQRERAQFRATYDEAIEILPPDRYQDVVVRPATGCPNAQCTFCAFYQGRLTVTARGPEVVLGKARRHLLLLKQQSSEAGFRCGRKSGQNLSCSG